MRIQNILKVISAFMVIVLLAPHVSNAQIDYERMEKDLRISKDILKNLMSDRSSRDFFEESKVEGLYIDRYGVVFMVPLTSRSFSGEKASQARERRETLKDNLIDFLSSYAGVINQVKPSDNITIVTTPSSSQLIGDYFVVESLVGQNTRSDRFTSKPFVMSVKKSEIERLRKGQIDENQFRNLVGFNEIGNDSEEYVSKRMLKDIKIMKNVLEISIEDQFSKTISSSSIQGTYIKDYGVIFTINGGSSISVPLPTISGNEVVFLEEVEAQRAKSELNAILLSQLEAAIEVRKKEVEETKNTGRVTSTKNDIRIYEEYIKALRNNSSGLSNEDYLTNLLEILTESIGEYGQTLRDLKPDEKVSVLYTSRGSRLRQQGNKSLMVSVAYGDVVAFSLGKINLAAFKSRINTKTF